MSYLSCATQNLKTQCKECLLCWNQGIVYCTCGHLLKESEASRGAIQCTFDLLSIQNYVIKKGRPHGHRYGKTKEQRDHHIAHNLRKRCIRHFEGIHDRFLKDPVFRASQLEHDRDEEVCIQMDAQKDFRHHMTQSEYFRYRRNWWISLNNDRTSGRLKNRSDFNEALSTLQLLHQESGERQLRPVPFWSINTGTNHGVLPPVGGNGAIPGGAHNDSNESPHMSDVQSDMIER